MSPKLTTAGLLRYEWPAFNGTLSLQAEGKYDSPVYFTTLNAPVERRAALFLGDVRGGYSFKTNGYAVDLTAFVRNVTNRVWFTYGVDTSSLGFAQYSLAPPRIFGGNRAISLSLSSGYQTQHQLLGYICIGTYPASPRLPDSA